MEESTCSVSMTVYFILMESSAVKLQTALVYFILYVLTLVSECLTLYYYSVYFIIINFIIVPPIDVRITKSEVIPTAGQDYSLTCNVSGIESSTYQWMKNGTSLHETGSSLYFRPIKLSNAGKYFCIITFNTWTFNDSIAIIVQSKSKHY